MKDPGKKWATGRALVVLIASLTMAVSLAACGGSSESSSSTAASEGTGGTSSTASESGGETAAQKRLNQLYEGTYGLPPKTAPKPQPGKDIWLISCGQSVAACANGIAGAKEASEALGWKTTLYDTKGDPSAMLDGVRSAVAAKAGGIFVYAIDCSLIKSGLQEAKEAGIPVVGAESADCSDVEKGAPSLFSYVTHYVDNRTFPEYIREWGAAQAAWDIVETDEQAKVIVFKETDGFSVLTAVEGAEEELAKCKTCEIVDTVEFTLGELGPALQQKASQALLQHPEANAVEVPYDAVMTSGVAAALRASGNLSKMRIMGGEGNVANMDMIREDNGQDAVVGLPLEWEGWAAIDNLNRIIDGKPTAETGIGLQVVDDEHNMTPSGPFIPQADGKPIPFAKLYKKAFAGQ
ncbi:MAG TPA: substrate-binding domain-containing protein [Solirubrobacterales bacterium]|jgi:ribose transport system substrate-binding protein